MANVPLLLLCMFVVAWKPASASSCNSYPCLNDGVCAGTPGGYTCECATGYSGQNCEECGSIDVSESTDTELAQFERNQPKLYDNFLRPLNNIKFSVKAESGAYLLLQTNRTDFGMSGSNYNIGIGGWTGIRNVISQNGVKSRVYIYGILNSRDFRKFWASWNTTTISVGRGDTIGSDTFITYTAETKLVDIVGVSFGVGWYSAAEWKFAIALNECDVQPCEPNEVCADRVFNYTCICE